MVKKLIVGHRYDEMLKASSASGDALKAYPYVDDGAHCPFTKYHGRRYQK
jgi:hypothetical protein